MLLYAMLCDDMLWDGMGCNWMYCDVMRQVMNNTEYIGSSMLACNSI